MNVSRGSIAIVIVLAMLLPLASTWTARISANASATIIYVPVDYAEIQWAIGNASEGSTIFVSAGIYYEHLTIDKALTLYGENQGATIDGNGTGDVIKVLANNVTISGFTVHNSGTGFWDSGIHLSNSDNGNISSNNATGNGHGIWLDGCNQTTVADNDFSSNQCGIGLSFCYNDSVTNNSVSSSNECGIGLDYSGNNTLTDNSVLYNGYGIWITQTGGNTIFRNDVINNVQQTHCFNSANMWDINGTGNYWSDYNGSDSNHDGIGDAPYQIDSNNVDDYPLMQTVAVPEFPSSIFLLLLVVLASVVAFISVRKLRYTADPLSCDQSGNRQPNGHISTNLEVRRSTRS